MQANSAPSYPFRIEVVPLLSSGGFGYGPHSLFILLANDLNRQEAAVTLWHEVLHMLKRTSDSGPHDESEIEKLANKLGAACPEVITLCGLDRYFTDVNKT